MADKTSRPENLFPHFRLAEEKDEPVIREIMEQGDFKGRISLRYTRRPHVLNSLKREGESVEIYYCQEGDKGAVGACAVNPMQIGKKLESVAYLFSFRLDMNSFSAIRHFKEGYAFHFFRMNQLDIQECYTTILSENKPAIDLLEKRRRSMPIYDFQGEIHSLTLKTGGSGKLPPGWKLEVLQEGKIEEALDFFHSKNERYSFTPRLKKEDLLQGKNTAETSCFRILRNDKGEIQAMGAIWDQRDYKQYEVMGYRGLFRFLRPISPLLFPLFGFPGLPRKGNILKMFCLAFCAVRDDDTTLFRHFIKSIKRDSRNFDSFTLGLHEKHPLLKSLKKFPHISYSSRFYRVYPWEKVPEPLNKIPYIEIGRL